MGIGDPSSNTPASPLELMGVTVHPIFTITAKHNTDYDPQVQYRSNATPVVTAAHGTDSGDSDKFKIHVGTGGIGDTSHFIIDTSGRVGIGTAEPNKNLHVYSATDHCRMQVQSDAKGSVNVMRSAARGWDCLFQFFEGASQQWAFGIASAYIDDFSITEDAGATQRLGIENSTGHIYIPSDTQYLKYGAEKDAGDTFSGADLIRDYDLLNSGTSNYRIQANGNDRVVVLAGGNVGINESTPQDTFEVNGTGLFKDKVKFTQDDGNEYIDSLADGYMDYGATTAHRFNNNITFSAGKSLSIADGEYAFFSTDAPNAGMKFNFTDTQYEWTNATPANIMELEVASGGELRLFSPDTQGLRVMGFAAEDYPTIGLYRYDTSPDDNEELGIIYFGDTTDKSDQLKFASIACYVDGTVGSTTDLPGRLVFSTTADGASTPTDVITIDSAQATQIGDAGTTNYVDIDATGDVTFVGGAGVQFGCISGADETVTCTDQNTYYQVTFDTAGPVNGVEADTTNNELQISKAGIYQVAVTACFHSGVSHDFELLVRKNDGATDLEPHLFQTTAVANQVENTSGSCMVDLTGATDRVELWVRCTDAAGQDAIFDHVSLTLHQIGGT
jgi:hypothetical protein